MFINRTPQPWKTLPLSAVYIQLISLKNYPQICQGTIKLAKSAEYTFTGHIMLKINAVMFPIIKHRLKMLDTFPFVRTSTGNYFLFDDIVKVHHDEM